MRHHELLTIPEVAALLNVHEITVRRMVKSKTLPAYRVGKVYRFRREEIDAYLRSVREQPIQQPPQKPVHHSTTTWIDELEMIAMSESVEHTFSRQDMITERG
jgi:excisionase family DNA binding protein